MNKKADITIMILVIGVVVVCFTALLSFYMAEMDTDNNFDYLSKISKIGAEMEKYSYYGKDEVETRTEGDDEHLYEVIKHSTGFLRLGSMRTFFEVRYYLKRNVYK